MTQHLQDQVAQIIDEGEGTHRRVIIQMDHLTHMAKRWLTAAAETGRQRAMNLDPRAMLPAPADSYLRKTGAPLAEEQRRRLLAAGHSLSARIAVSQDPVGMRRPPVRRFMNYSARSLRPLERSSVTAKLRSTKARAAATRTFWTAGAMAMEVSKDELAQLVKDVHSSVAAVFPNYTVTLPSFGEGNYLADNKTSSWGIDTIGAMSVWGAYGKRGRDTTIAVLDTGIDPNHPDLLQKLSAFAEFDANGAIIPNAVPRDSAEHGTHVAGTIVGGNSGGRWIGVAPDARVASALVLPNGSGEIAQILAGMEWAIDQGVDVINMSLGELAFSPEVLSTYTRTVITAAQFGIPVVAAVGNEGSQTTGSPGNDFLVYAVGATDNNDRIAGFSGGRTHVVEKSPYINPDSLPLVFQKPNISAPGVGILSCVPGGQHKCFNGTSMAAPHVAGAMALLLSATSIRRKVAARERALVLQDLLTGSVDEFGEAGQDHRYGWGRVNVLRAVGDAGALGFG